MNINVQKYGPPAAVIGIALYLGWPPAPPLDLGEDVVRAKSVRWKVSDLEAPTLPVSSGENPFAEVLVKPETSQLNELGATVDLEPELPTGPTVEDLQQGIQLAGIAQTDHHRWAIVNSRVCRKGDRVAVIGRDDLTAEIREIRSDHITVVADQLVAHIRPQQRKRKAAKTPAPSKDQASAKTAEATDEEPDEEDREVKEQESDREKPSGDRKRSGYDPREQFFQPAT